MDVFINKKYFQKKCSGFLNTIKRLVDEQIIVIKSYDGYKDNYLYLDMYGAVYVDFDAYMKLKLFDPAKNDVMFRRTGFDPSKINGMKYFPQFRATSTHIVEHDPISSHMLGGRDQTESNPEKYGNRGRQTRRSPFSGEFRPTNKNILRSEDWAYKNPFQIEKPFKHLDKLMVFENTGDFVIPSNKLT